MRLFGLLNFYDEPPSQLKACIEGLAVAGVTHLVAVDGAYDLFPGGKPASPAAQRTMIDRTCRQHDISSMVYVPKRTWVGNEVEKRTFMHNLALAASDETVDWHMVMDADQVVIRSPPDLITRLSSCHQDVADVKFYENGEFFSKPRILFRAIPIRLERNHYTYMAGPRVLWSADDQPQEGALDMTDIIVDHRPKGRSAQRLVNRAGYYEARDESNTELVNCVVCYGRAVKKMPRDWRETDLGFQADWIEICERCSAGVEATNRGKLAQFGLDPNMVTVVTHEGYAYAVADHTRGLPDLFHEWLETRA